MYIDTDTFVAALPERCRYEVDRMFRQIAAQADSGAEPIQVRLVVYSAGARSAPQEGLSEDEERRIRMALGVQ